VQPLITDNYVEVSSPDGDYFVRADKNWDWEQNFQLLVGHNCLCDWNGFAHGEAIAMCVVIKPEENDDEFPIGMLIAVPKFYCNVYNHERYRG
ncbi:hypothetical protein, partial [Pseudomonas viridiflava]|uniref:hypothetical protein n=1 Tax=Pseudomonas viridiflava TaxID=33069 RepID=UPI00197FF843